MHSQNYTVFLIVTPRFVQCPLRAQISVLAALIAVEIISITLHPNFLAIRNFTKNSQRPSFLPGSPNSLRGSPNWKEDYHLILDDRKFYDWSPQIQENLQELPKRRTKKNDANFYYSATISLNLNVLIDSCCFMSCAQYF